MRIEKDKVEKVKELYEGNRNNVKIRKELKKVF